MKKKDGKILTENSEIREIWRQICEVLFNVVRSPEVTARPAGILKVLEKVDQNIKSYEVERTKTS